MKRIIILILLSALFTLGLFAHPANKVTASFNAETSILTVEYEHKVNNANDHFINNITVSLNGRKAIEQLLSLQESAAGGTFIYKMPGLKKGDKIAVQTECNKGGKKSSTITIP